MRCLGKGKPEFWIAERTRSFASCRAASGRPTIVKCGMPLAMSTSTSTSSPSRPATAQDCTFARAMSLLWHKERLFCKCATGGGGGSYAGPSLHLPPI